MSVPDPSFSPESAAGLSSSARTLADLLVRTAQQHPRCGIRLISKEHESESKLISYPALLTDARRVLAGLCSTGHPPGGKVALLLEYPGDIIPAFWACVLGGYIPCPLAPIRNDSARWSRQLSHVTELLEQPLLVTSPALLAELPSGTIALDLEVLRQDNTQTLTHRAAPDDLAVLMLTSGSTGNSKAVALSHRNLLTSMAGRADRQRLTSSDVTLNWIAFDHVAALLESHMIALYVGATQLHIEPAPILADPVRFLRLIDRYHVSLAFAPNFMLGQINAALQSFTPGSLLVRRSLDLSCLRRIVTGGEANLVDTGVRFLELLAPFGLNANALWPAYGMTETCAASLYSSDFPQCDLDCEFASVGQPIEGMEVRVVNEQGMSVYAGEAGELQVRGPLVFSGYYNDDQATKAAFTADGWFHTGDLAQLEGQRVRLVGRKKDCIIVSGANYFSHELEAAVERIEGIERSFTAVFPTRPKGADTEQVVVAFTPTFALDDEVEMLRVIAAIREATILLWGFRPALVLPLPKSAFPKTSLGKIQRALMRKRLETGEFAGNEAIVTRLMQGHLGEYRAPESPTEAAIVGVYADIFKLDPAVVSSNANFFDLGGTSLDIIRLKQQLEGRLHLPNVSMIRILQNPTPRALAKPEPSGYDPLVALQVSGSKTPVFCVHPATGEVLVFVALAGYFVNERPFYALRARGFNQGEKPFDSLQEMVSIYTQAIRRKQPRGPYAIAGYSFGAAVAFEIAKTLEAQGEQVAFCGSMDGTVFVGDRDHKLDELESAFRVAYFLGLVDMQQMLQLPTALRATATGVDPYRAVFDVGSSARMQQLDLDLETFRTWAKLSFALVTLGQEYVPSGSVESVTVFYAEPLWGTKQEWLECKLAEWNMHTRAPPRYVEVSGTHSSLLESDHVAGFQAALRAELERSLDGR